jgi:hypothetical protein
VGALRGPAFAHGRIRFGAAAMERPLQGQAALEQPEGRPGNRMGIREGCPRWGRWATASSGFPYGLLSLRWY